MSAEWDPAADVMVYTSEPSCSRLLTHRPYACVNPAARQNPGAGSALGGGLRGHLEHELAGGPAGREVLVGAARLGQRVGAAGHRAQPPGPHEREELVH